MVGERNALDASEFFPGQTRHLAQVSLGLSGSRGPTDGRSSQHRGHQGMGRNAWHFRRGDRCHRGRKPLDRCWITDRKRHDSHGDLGLYPLGQIAFEHVDIDPAAGAWSEANAMAFNGSAVRILHSYHPPAPDDSWLLHSVVSLNPTSGQINGILYGPTGGQRPGRDLAWTSGGWLKLTQTDGFPQLDRSMLLTHYSPNGTYQSQGAWGTIFEDDPSHVTESEDGTIWVAGSTRGAIDGTWNACVLRLDSLGPLGTWSGELPGFGVYNDPLFDNVVGVSDLETLEDWFCAPNPAATLKPEFWGQTHN